MAARLRLAHGRPEDARMTDLAMIALTFVFFLLAWLYARACERV
jgi:hypothetical protein